MGAAVACGLVPVGQGHVPEIGLWGLGFAVSKRPRPGMKAIIGLSLLLVLCSCENQKKETRVAAEYRQQSAVESACSQLERSVEKFHLKASAVHSEWMRIETVKDEQRREEEEKKEAEANRNPKDPETLIELRRQQAEKKAADLAKELKEATTAMAEADDVYRQQIQQIEAALKSGRALLQADAKQQSLKKLDEEVTSAGRLLTEVPAWKQRAEDAALRYMATPETDKRMDAQREYFQIAKEHWKFE